MSMGVLILSSCVDEYTYDPAKDPTYVGSAPSELDFSTTQNVQLCFNYTAMDGFTSVYDVYTEYPLDEHGSLRKDLTPIAGGIHVAGQSDPNRVIPSYVNELYVYSPSLFVPLVSYAKVANGVADFEIAEIKTKSSGEMAKTRSTPYEFWSKFPDKYLKEENDFYQETTAGNYKYDLIAPDKKRALSSKVATDIANAFPESQIVDRKYYKDATITIQAEGAEVFLSILYGGGSFNNSLSYIVNTGAKKFEDMSRNERDELDFEVINVFQYADVYTNTFKTQFNRGLTPGNYVQLLYKNEEGNYVKEFPKGAQIAWILNSNRFDDKSTGLKLKSKEDRSFTGSNYSVSNWNNNRNLTIDENGDSCSTTNYNIFFSTVDEDDYVYNCFGFEDKSGEWIHNGGSDGDCNDVIFHVMTNPADAIIPPPTIPSEEIEHTEEKKGILAFEDNWPKQGDYDMNDVVVKYVSTITYVKKQEEGALVTVKRVVDKFSLIHTGATFHNAFSYKVDLSPSVIESIKITNERTQVESDYTGDIVKDGDGFIIDLCADVAAVITPMEFGTEPQDYTVVMTFKEGAVKEEDLDETNKKYAKAPYNPFISPKSGVEVHLSNYPPTGRAEKGLFGTEDDRSKGDEDLWYVSGDNNLFPFAIHLSDVGDEFTVPAEYYKISETYPRYENWVNSGMTTDKNWYIK